MNNLFDKKYLLKSFISLVRDENNRIVSSGLANNNEIRTLMDNLSKHIVKNADLMIDGLALVHQRLKEVQFPGDFNKMACGLQEDMFVILDIPCEVQEFVIVPEKEDDEKSDEDKEEDKKTENEDLEKKTKEIIEAQTIPHLEKLAYEYGKMGKHKVAYIIENHIKYLNSLINRE